MASVRSNEPVTKRAGAAALLLGFLLAMLLGAFHPLGAVDVDAGHVCGAAAERHLDAEHHPHHDAAACALCHLVHEVALVDDAPPLVPAPSFRAPAPDEVVRARPWLPPLSSARPRAPPSTPAVAS